jgi:hypothetical protein
MRWYVQISPVGKGPPKQKLCLEAAHWQPALQEARRQRSEDDKLSGLSVEFLDNGCSAIDSTLRLKYLVSQAPDDAELVAATSARANVSSAAVSSAARDTAIQKTAEESPSSKSKPDAKPKSDGKDALRSTQVLGTGSVKSKGRKSGKGSKKSKRITGNFGSKGVARASKPGSLAPEDPDVPPVPPSTGSPDDKRLKKTAIGIGLTDASPKSGPSSDPLSGELKKTTLGLGQSKSTPDGVKYALVGEGRRDGTPEVPITYFEIAFGLQAVMKVRKIGSFMRARLKELQNVTSGEQRMIDIALFDHVYGDSPARPPVATLQWRQWRPDAREVLYFPYSPQPTNNADDARKALGAAIVDPEAPKSPKAKPAVEPSRPAEPKRKSKPKLSTDAADVDSSPPSRAVKVVPVVEVGAVEESKAKPDAASSEQKPASKKKSPKPAAVKPAAQLKDAGLKDAGLKNAGSEAAGSKAAAPKDTLPIDTEPATTQPADTKPAETDKDPKGSRRSSGGSRRSLSGRSKGKRSRKTLDSQGVAAGVVAKRSDAAKAAAATKPGYTSRGTLESKTGAKDRNSKPATQKVKLGSGEGRKRRQSPPPVDELQVEALSPAERDQRMKQARDSVSSLAPPVSMRGSRVAGDQLIADLFEAVSELHYLNDALEGAHFVLALALEKLPSEVGMISLFDIDKREFVVVHQTGGEHSALLLRVPEKSPLQRKAMRSRRAVVVENLEQQPDMLDERWRTVGIQPTSIICAPVEVHGRYMGLIELVNPYDGGVFQESDGYGLTYIGEQYAEFLSERGISIDPEAVVAQAQPR